MDVSRIVFAGGKGLRRAALAIAVFAMPATGLAADEKGGKAAGAPTAVEQFCVNVADKARDARFAWEMRTLEDLRKEVEQRTAELEAKRAELEEWVRRREEFASRAEGVVVDIYARMRPDAAATQLAALDSAMAAVVLSKLDARVSSAILNEMATPKAVMLAEILAGAGATGAGK